MNERIYMVAKIKWPGVNALRAIFIHHQVIESPLKASKGPEKRSKDPKNT